MSQIVKFIQTDLGYNNPYSLLTISQIENKPIETTEVQNGIQTENKISKFRISDRKSIHRQTRRS
jgi:hypothetical protein